MSGRNSFSIETKDLTLEQILAISTVNESIRHNYSKNTHSWDICIHGNTIQGGSINSDFNMEGFLYTIGVSPNIVFWNM